eukprot:1156203-Pelagomonas_calceolata.AAC.2
MLKEGPDEHCRHIVLDISQGLHLFSGPCTGRGKGGGEALCDVAFWERARRVTGSGVRYQKQTPRHTQPKMAGGEG